MQGNIPHFGATLHVGVVVLCVASMDEVGVALRRCGFVYTPREALGTTNTQSVTREGLGKWSAT